MQSWGYVRNCGFFNLPPFDRMSSIVTAKRSFFLHEACQSCSKHLSIDGQQSPCPEEWGQLQHQRLSMLPALTPQYVCEQTSPINMPLIRWVFFFKKSI